MLKLDHTSICAEPPKKGDTLIIETKKSKCKKILVIVKNVIDSGDGAEIVLNKSTNSYFIWSMYLDGSSWVRRVYNLGEITHTASTNNMNNLSEL